MSDSITQVAFPFADRRSLCAVFDAEPISSDGGAPLLVEAERRLGILAGMAAIVGDAREARRVAHTVEEMLRQRVFQIALGYADCNDANVLRRDGVLKACCGQDPVHGADLASQPTLTRLENSVGPKTCYLLGREQVESYVRRHRRRQRRIIIDLDTTEDRLHGQQELRFFHAYYNEYVYLPLLVFDQDGDLIASVLQPGRPCGVKVAVPLLRRTVARFRRQWPGVEIVVRGDSGFASPAMYAMCDEMKADFAFGIGPNARFKERGRPALVRAVLKQDAAGPESKAKEFTAFWYRARKWKRPYRLLCKAECTALGTNMRYVVTTLPGKAADVYKLYIQRAEACENSIKDLKVALSGDRLSCHRFWANQFRLFMHAAAYVLMFELRRAAADTELASAQMDTLRLRLLKIGVRVASSVRRVWFHLSASYPWRDLWATVARRLLAPHPA